MSQLLLTNLGVVCPNCDELSQPGAARCASCGADPYGATPPAKALPRAGTGASMGGRPATQSTMPGFGGTPPPRIPPVPQVPAAPAPQAPLPRASTGSQLPAAPTPQAPLPRASTGSQLPATAPTPQGPLPAAGRPSGPKEQPPGLAARLGAKVVDVAPPGIRPAARPAGAAHPDQPIPASELVRRPPSVPPAPAPPSKFSLAALAGAQRGQRVRLSQSCQIGKSRGQILFPEDPYLSPLHASLTVRDGRLYIRDENSASGTFVSVPGQEQIQQNAHFSAGQRLFRFMGLLNAPQSARSGAAIIYGAPLPPGHVVYGVEEVLVGNRGGRAVVTGGALLTIGSSKCDLSYPGDEGMATRHCELSPTPSGALLRDLSGGLGTYLRLTGTERALNPGDKIRIGNQVLQVEA